MGRKSAHPEGALHRWFRFRSNDAYNARFQAAAAKEGKDVGLWARDLLLLNAPPLPAKPKAPRSRRPTE